MGEKPTVAIRTNSKEQKREWQNAVEESEEYDSMSHLIRRAVSRELADGSNRVESSDPVDSDQLGKVMESVERIDARTQELTESVSRLEDRTYSEGGLSDETLQTVFAELPIGEGIAISGDESTLRDDIAERTGLEPTTVEMTLEQLRNDIESVDYIERPDGRHWFRSG